MEQQQSQSQRPSPHSWSSGPPESKSESWNYERRTELLNVASGILQAQVMGATRRGEPWKGEGSCVSPTEAVRLAKELIDATEKVQPKL
jgi:hypothetical protein